MGLLFLIGLLALFLGDTGPTYFWLIYIIVWLFQAIKIFKGESK